MFHIVTGAEDNAFAQEICAFVLISDNKLGFYFSVVSHEFYSKNHHLTTLYFVFTLHIERLKFPQFIEFCKPNNKIIGPISYPQKSCQKQLTKP